MSLDLFFVPRSPAFEVLREPGYTPTAAQAKARRSMITALLQEFPGTSLHGDELRGAVDGLPGTMLLQPGCVFWSLKSVGEGADLAEVQAMVDWFRAHRMVCEDVQDAGFGNRYPRAAEERVDSMDALIGARFQRLQLDPNADTGLRLEWILADGRQASQRLAHFTACELPELASLRDARVASVERVHAPLDDITLTFGPELTLRLTGCAPDGIFVRKAPQR